MSRESVISSVVFICPYYRIHGYGYMGQPTAKAAALLSPLNRPCELRGVDRNVRLHFGDLVLFTSADPTVRPFVGDLHARDRAIVGIVDLRRHAADHGICVAHHAR